MVRGVELRGSVGGQTYDRVRSQQSPRECGRRVVLSDMDAVGFHLEREVGPVVEDERHAMVVTDAPDAARDLEQRPGFELLVAQLHDVDAARDACLEKALEIGTGGGAEIEPARSERDHDTSLDASAAGDGPHQLEPIALGENRGGGVAPVHGHAVALDEHPPTAQPELREQIVDGRAVGQFDGIAVRGHPHGPRRYLLTVRCPLADTVDVAPPVGSSLTAHRGAGAAPDPAGPVVELEHVSRRFGNAVGLSDLTLQVPPGSVTVLLGPNGAGKTTAVRTITGALDCDTGRVRVFGHDPAVEGEAVRRRCGVVSAKPALYDRLSGRDNLRYAAELNGLGKHAPITASAARFGIEHSLDVRVSGYSTGMKTRLALARAVLHDPDLLLLDEPTSGLDPESAHAVLRLIDDMAAGGKTVVMCTHLLLEAEGLADQVVILDHGRDLLSGAPDELVRRFWPYPTVVFDAENRSGLDVLAGLDGVKDFERNGGAATVTLDDLARIPDLVQVLTSRGARLTRVAPHEPTLEELYFAVRRSTGARVDRIEEAQ
jgi:ABC-2 type transport system ATP-binding protein